MVYRCLLYYSYNFSIRSSLKYKNQFFFLKVRALKMTDVQAPSPVFWFNWPGLLDCFKSFLGDSSLQPELKPVAISFFVKVHPDSQYFQGHMVIVPTQLCLGEQEQHKQYLHKWVWLCSNKTLFAKKKKTTGLACCLTPLSLSLPLRKGQVTTTPTLMNCPRLF